MCPIFIRFRPPQCIDELETLLLPARKKRAQPARKEEPRPKSAKSRKIKERKRSKLAIPRWCIPTHQLAKLEETFAHKLFKKVQEGGRPEVTARDEEGAPEGYVALMRELWAQEPLARPTFDAALALVAKSDWDLAAADLIAREAGAYCGDHLGRGFAYNASHPAQTSLVCAAPRLAPLILDRVRHIALPG